jgi:hypothetical protein
MSVWVEEAIRNRRCNECGQCIPSGENHIKFCSNSRYTKNLCKHCMNKLMREIYLGEL